MSNDYDVILVESPEIPETERQRRLAMAFDLLLSLSEDTNDETDDE